MFSEFFQKLRAMNVLPQLHVEGSEATHKE